jgi:acetyltransferase-like isoleucine patch superfamily enzyme
MEYAGNGITRIMGDLQLYIGSNVTIFDNTSFVGLKIFDKPELHIGDNSYLGPDVSIMVGREIRIGRNCAIGSVLITDNPGHSTNIFSRLESGSGSPNSGDIRPVKIGDFCWFPLGTYVYPGVTVGDGVVALAGTHINKDVPPFCRIAGQPMRIICKLPIPPEIVNLVGNERYESYLKAHEELKL